MNRREIIVLLGVMAFQVPSPPLSAQSLRKARIGFLTGGVSTAEGGSLTGALETLKEGLHQLGWREGDTFNLEARFGNGDFSFIPHLAAELVARQPDVIVATGSSETKALQAATGNIPIVFLQIADPLSLGVVDSIARPGRNITGFSQGPQILWGKRLEILAELLGRQPHRLAYLCNPGNAGTGYNWTAAIDAAAKHGAELTRVEVSKPDELDSAFDALKDRDALLVQ